MMLCWRGVYVGHSISNSLCLVFYLSWTPVHRLCGGAGWKAQTIIKPGQDSCLVSMAASLFGKSAVMFESDVGSKLQCSLSSPLLSLREFLFSPQPLSPSFVLLFFATLVLLLFYLGLGVALFLLVPWGEVRAREHSAHQLLSGGKRKGGSSCYWGPSFVWWELFKSYYREIHSPPHTPSCLFLSQRAPLPTPRLVYPIVVVFSLFPFVTTTVYTRPSQWARMNVLSLFRSQILGWISDCPLPAPKRKEIPKVQILMADESLSEKKRGVGIMNCQRGLQMLVGELPWLPYRCWVEHTAEQSRGWVESL